MLLVFVLVLEMRKLCDGTALQRHKATLPLTYVDRYSPEQRRRLDAIPGITGWAQVHGRNALDWPTKLAYDVWYVDNASPRVDLQIIGLTLRAVLSRSGVTAIDHLTMHEFLGDPPER